MRKFTTAWIKNKNSFVFRSSRDFEVLETFNSENHFKL